ncbi:MAG: hypothetical protein KF767_18095 [Bdellovibrionaceae bacterium]|nr:hypothetical protein [Pseudobdellovibrionaceae bacterium]
MNSKATRQAIFKEMLTVKTRDTVLAVYRIVWLVEVKGLTETEARLKVKQRLGHLGQHSRFTLRLYKLRKRLREGLEER